MSNSKLFAYDDLDRLSFATNNDGDNEYAYDGIGNRLSHTQDGTQENYQYGSGSHQLLSRAGNNYTYDATGNSLSTNDDLFDYSNRNRMERVTVDGVSTTYMYNAMGLRVRKAGPDTDTHYIYDLEGRVIAEAEASSGMVTVEYAYLDAGPLAQWRTETQPPVPPMPISPLSTTDTATPTYRWEPEAGSTRYQIRIYDQSAGSFVKNAQYSPGAICTTSSCDAQPQGYSLNTGTGHYWQVRAQNELGWGEWSDQISIDYVESAP